MLIKLILSPFFGKKIKHNVSTSLKKKKKKNRKKINGGMKVWTSSLKFLIKCGDVIDHSAKNRIHI